MLVVVENRNYEVNPYTACLVVQLYSTLMADDEASVILSATLCLVR